MSTSTMPPLHLNGTGVVPAELLREAEFLQKILQIRDQVFASKHPRIHLPPKIIEQVAPRLPQSTPNNKASTNGTPNGIASQSLPPRPGSSFQHPTPPLPPTQRPYSATSSSGIDPVLLTKSDHLIKAELQLKRQQIERHLKDQFDKKGRGNDTEEREALINVEECLLKAHLRVPPVSGLRSTANNSDGAESFDENSYYSSKADSWSSDEVEPKQSAHADATSPLTSQANQSVRPVVPQSRPVEPTVIDLDEETYEPADDIEIYEPDSTLLQEDPEDEDYSPPPADIGPSEPIRGRARARGAGNGDTNGSRRQSPAGPTAPLQNPRKRRRDEKRDEKRRQQQANKRAVPSPEPYIKQEPQSPPQFAAYPDAQPSKRRALQSLPSDMDVVSLQEGVRAQPIYYRDQEPAPRPYREIEDPSTPTVIHVPQRRPQRDEQDLRRVASLQYARRPYSPGGGSEMFQIPEARQMRAVSHAFVDRSEPPIYREASARPSAAPRYVRERSRSPVLEYLPRQPSPILMAPPPRRIVIDQYGNKYYAAPVDARESMAPHSRRIDADPFYERAVTREPTMRAPARMELYEDDMAQRMPPPPRRYVEASDPELIESPVYRQRESSRRPVEVEYRPMPQYSERAPPRDYASPRSYSMRPESIRREVAEGVRHESVQPGPVRVSQPRFREVSIAHQEPFDERRFISAPQSRRYVDEGPIEVAQDPYSPAEPRRVYARY
ncbi:hypothetical protein T440DRAFT_469224 [Plenodomus tracheiphilus IPT5]|uniref:Uncharacterized protein n=1 Tax=Plenodomus tracheiphilus IPT5 TaxID=1408161 RepID=A0A6A7B2Q7_9PLEO|nr:hypothetical protein T440DRAFT_469224 [Plenodomus tracheiphilus IPT5]